MPKYLGEEIHPTIQLREEVSEVIRSLDTVSDDEKIEAIMEAVGRFEEELERTAN